MLFRDVARDAIVAVSLLSSGFLLSAAASAALGAIDDFSHPAYETITPGAAAGLFFFLIVGCPAAGLDVYAAARYTHNPRPRSYALGLASGVLVAVVSFVLATWILYN